MRNAYLQFEDYHDTNYNPRWLLLICLLKETNYDAYASSELRKQ